MAKNFNQLFAMLVPSSGKSGTLEGEVLRAYNRIKYRLFNDGDMPQETASPLAFLMQYAPNILKNTITKIKFARFPEDAKKELEKLENGIVDWVNLQLRKCDFTLPKFDVDMFDVNPSWQYNTANEDE